MDEKHYRQEENYAFLILLYNYIYNIFFVFAVIKTEIANVFHQTLFRMTVSKGNIHCLKSYIKHGVFSLGIDELLD